MKNVIFNALVTGAAGFVGSNLVDKLLSMNYSVIGIDNLSTGRLPFLERALSHPNFKFINADLKNVNSVVEYFSGVDKVFHFSANADVRNEKKNTSIDLNENTIVTSNVLECARINKVSQFIFSSTGSVYGEAIQIPTREDSPFPIQTSLYGASKLACEGLITSYSEAFEMQVFIFRFVSILGERYTHGHIYDFYKQLSEDRNRLRVLGDGSQRKSYLYIQDCLSAILYALKFSNDRVNIFNLGTDEYCQVNDSINWICEALGVNPAISYTGGNKGWIGDNPFIFLDCKKIRETGWIPAHSIRDSVIKTVNFIKSNNWILN